jgi:hypothetical protein
MFSKFYNESIRKLIIGFGSLFNDINVERKNSDGTIKESIRVPIAYGPKEKFLRRLQESSSISDATHTQITLPRLGFDITGIQYDPSRKGNKLRKTKAVSADGLVTSYNYAEVPYNISLGLYAFSRNQNDNLQIIEQILPYFSPEFIVSMKINDINAKIDVPVVLNGVSTVEEYEGEFDSRRNLTSTFEFTAKTFIYGPARTSRIILQSDIDIFGTDEAFASADVTGAQDLRIGITGGYSGGYTSGAQIYGDYYYE